MPHGRKEGSETVADKQKRRIFWFQSRILALATTLPLYITLQYAQFKSYKNRVHRIVLLTSLRTHNKVVSTSRLKHSECSGRKAGDWFFCYFLDETQIFSSPFSRIFSIQIVLLSGVKSQVSHPNSCAYFM
jgi:hypothetical protein